MYSKSSLKVSSFLLLLITMFSLSACNADSVVSEMEFSFSTNTSANSSDEKTIYINNDMDKVQLNAELNIDSGDVIIQVLNVSNEEVIWSGNYKEDSNFKIDLFDLKADSEYLVKINATQSKNVKLIITSDNKLIKEKEKPPKYKIEK